MSSPPQVGVIGKNESIFLDVVRTLSAQAVLVGHCLAFSSGGKSFLGDALPIQTLGVVVFFVLSGYLISTTTQRRVAANTGYLFWHFFVDRFARIYVTLVPCLLVVLLLDSLNHSLAAYDYKNAFNAPTFIGNLFMLQDHPVLLVFERFRHGLLGWTITSFGSDRPLWTLAVEWWLYMAFGWATLKLAASKVRTPLEMVVTGLLFIAPILYALGDRREILSLCWLAGWLIASTRGLPLPQLTRPRLIYLLLAVLFLFVLRLKAASDFYDLHAALFLCIAFWIGLRLVAGFPPFALPSFVKTAISVLAGSSYALYALHYSILAFAITRFEGDIGLAGWVICAIVAEVAAVCVYLLFDRHHRAIAIFLKSRLTEGGLASSPKS